MRSALAARVVDGAEFESVVLVVLDGMLDGMFEVVLEVVLEGVEVVLEGVLEVVLEGARLLSEEGAVLLTGWLVSALAGAGAVLVAGVDCA